MNADDVNWLYRSLEDRGVRIWIDGGWCVDALLGAKTREHADLDLAIDMDDVPTLTGFLLENGFVVVPDTDRGEWNMIFEDGLHRKIDIHAFVVDANGNGVLGPKEFGHQYPAGALSGAGEIDGTPVRCIAAAFMVLFKTSYEARSIDLADVSALCKKFKLANPHE